jgi:hypothetical protein
MAGLYLLLRRASNGKRPIGIVIKLRRDKMFSERYGGWRGFDIGPLYVRTYRRRWLSFDRQCDA